MSDFFRKYVGKQYATEAQERELNKVKVSAVCLSSLAILCDQMISFSV